MTALSLHKLTNPQNSHASAQSKLTTPPDSCVSAKTHQPSPVSEQVKLTNYNDSPAFEWLWIPVAADMMKSAFELLRHPRYVGTMRQPEETLTQYDAIKMRRRPLFTFNTAL